VADKRMLKLIRAFLEAGVMEDGLVSPVDEGTAQGGPLSPLLSNLALDELDRELERRGHHFVRYADDCNIYVGSERAGQRVMESVTRFITHRLKLKVNQAKSAVARLGQRKSLGFSFTGERESWLRRRLRSVLWKQWKKGRTRFRELRKRGVSKDLAAQTAGSAHGPWRIAKSPALNLALPNAYFDSLGLPAMVTRA
jgi:RNA-directed DNA polymerase